MLIALLIAVGIGILLIWLVNINAWWWLLAAPICMFILFGVIVAVVVRVVIRLASPTLSKKQDQGVKRFVDKLERVAENVQTPPIILLFRIIKDMIRPSEKTFIQAFAEDSTTLHKDFAELERTFNA